MREITTQEAFQIIKQAMIDDSPSEPGSYARTWQCNIAMMCYDAILDAQAQQDREIDVLDAKAVGNDAASRFMKMCFDVENEMGGWGGENKTIDDMAINIIIDDSGSNDPTLIDITNDAGEQIRIGCDQATDEGWRKLRITVSDIVKHLKI